MRVYTNILGTQIRHESSDCQIFLPTLPRAATFQATFSPDKGAYVGLFSCVEGYHMIGDPNGYCDETHNTTNKWNVGTKENIPRCFVNLANNKPAYQSGSPDTEDLLLAASKGNAIQNTRHDKPFYQHYCLMSKL